MHSNPICVVRGTPIINATMDARYVGMDRQMSSRMDMMHHRQLLINVQKNFKSILTMPMWSSQKVRAPKVFAQTQRLFCFLLMVKCDVIAEALGLKKVILL